MHNLIYLLENVNILLVNMYTLKSSQNKHLHHSCYLKRMSMCWNDNRFFFKWSELSIKTRRWS